MKSNIKRRKPFMYYQILKSSLFKKMRKLRWSALILAMSNFLVIILGIVLMVESSCEHHNDIFPVLLIVMVACVRVGSMIPAASIQRDVAMSVIASQSEINSNNSTIRQERRIRYKTWLRWTRFTMIFNVLQFIGASYVLLSIAKYIYGNTSPNCFIGLGSSGSKRRHNTLVLFIIIVGYVPFLQCFVGPDVLRWRSFYGIEQKIWKAHYQEVFDHGIREAFCCMGRVKYLTSMEEDEVYAVAQSLGDLVTYRASCTGHLEFLAGLALLQNSVSSPKMLEDLPVAPEDQMQEATMFHPFAEAAYTGVLLDLGRHPLTFSCTWLYRQGIFYPWFRDRLPMLQGDNFWRGHAKAFLKFVDLTPDALRKGRINQGKCKATYFIVVLHHLKTVVIAVRGTETPDDLITNGLCRECELTSEDLDGLINCNDTQLGQSGGLLPSLSSSPHYGHAGVVEATRDLYTQVEGESITGGFLSTLLKQGCECDGYDVKIVGHSLGGAIAALLGLRLRGRFPKLHVYAYGPLPCVDFEVANACSEFITSIVYDNEFSSRLSVASILRLQAAAVKALADDGATDSTSVLNLARHFLYLSYFHHNQISHHGPGVPDSNDHIGHIQCSSSDNDVGFDSERSSIGVDFVDRGHTSGCSSTKSTPFENNKSEHIMEVIQSCDCASTSIPEMYLPGLIIHIVPEEKNELTPLWRKYTFNNGYSHRAYLVKRDAFKDIVVSPYMFLDHLPWRCYSAMKNVIDIAKFQAPKDGAQMV